jgi:signal transduction histidine kinase
MSGPAGGSASAWFAPDDHGTTRPQAPWAGEPDAAQQARWRQDGPGSGPQPGPDQGAEPGQHGLFHRVYRGHGSGQPLRRERDGRQVAGIIAGLSAKSGVDVTALRVAMVVLTLLTSGLAAAAYVLTWLLLPVAGESTNIASRALADKRGIALSAAIAAVLGLILVVISALGAGWLNTVAWPIIITVCGMVLVWRNAPPDEQDLLHRLTEPLVGTAGRAKDRLVLRIVITAALALSGLGFLLSGKHQLDLLEPLLGVALILSAAAIAMSPWLSRVARDLVDERQARIRAEERADMAVRVHDSVLQTLALIQRRASEPQQVIQLARSQERELRSWLFDGQAPGSMQGEGVTLAAGIRKIQREVEAQHRIEVDAVTVGDCELEEDLEALLAAAREATVNAAKWSGCSTVSVFAEVESDSVSVYVRDRGAGFDPESVPADRKGLAESIRARLARRGGSAIVRSAPGKGTEVCLTMPRAVAARAGRPT